MGRGAVEGGVQEDGAGGAAVEGGLQEDGVGQL